MFVAGTLILVAMRTLTVDSCDVGLPDGFCWYCALKTLFAVKLLSLACLNAAIPSICRVRHYCLISVGRTGHVLPRPLFLFHFSRATSSGRPRQPGEIVVGFSGDAIEI